jgi:chromosome segregation ATPase
MASNRSLNTAPDAPAQPAAKPPAEAAEIARLKGEAERWRAAARRTADEIGEAARAAVQRFEAQTAELARALDEARAETELARRRATALTRERYAAMLALEKARRRAEALKARVLRSEGRRLRMAAAWTWRAAAPVRALGRSLEPLLKSGARLRKRLLGRRAGR